MKTPARICRRKNIRMLNRLVCFFVFITLPCRIFGAAGVAPQSRFDSSRIQVRKFDRLALEDYRSDRDFNYGEIKRAAAPGVLERFWHWFWDLFPDLKVKKALAAKWSLLKYPFMLLGIAVIVFAIIKLTGMDFRSVFFRRSKQVDLPYSESLENIHEISFDAEIEKAINNRNYRLAVRLLYLNVLKGLNDAGRIRWQPDKTNSQYISEVKYPDQKNEFRMLTRQFEYVWYGGFELEEATFQRISNSFRNFNVFKR